MSLGEYLGAGPDITKGLYHLNGDANDSSGNGNNGTASNVTWVDGKFGQAGSFDGSSSYIETVYSLRGATIFTVSTWINTSDIANYRGIYSLCYQTSGAQEIWNLRQSNTGKIQLTDMVSWNEDSNTTLTTSTRYNVIYVRNGTNHKFYINGVLDKEFTRTVGKYTVTPIEGTSARIGRGVLSSAQFFKGLIDEVILENRAWTAEEAKKYYTYAKGRFGIQ